MAASSRKDALLLESSERLQLALAAGKLGDWAWNSETDQITLGDRAADIFGVPPNQPLTWTGLRDLLHPDDREIARMAVEAALDKKTDYSTEYRVQKPGHAEWTWVAAQGRGIYSNDGRVVGMVGVVQDISSERRAEETRSRLAAVVESSDDAIISMDLDGNITTWNSGAERTFGYSAAEAISKPITFLIPPERHGEEPAILERIKRGERIDHFETIRIRKDGARIHVSLTLSALRDSTGKLVGVSKISRDITAHKLAQEALTEETRILELLNETGTKIASQLDIESIVQTVTDAATTLTGAKFGAFFYNIINEQGEAFLLFTLSGAPREAFEKFGHPRATPLFGPTFRGEGVIRLDDVTKDSRYGHMSPHHGMPKGHLPVRSYLAVPVISRSGEVLGGLFFGHPDVGVFTPRSERLVTGLAAQASIAIDNANLYRALQREVNSLKKTQDVLKLTQQELENSNQELESRVEQRTHSLREAMEQMEEFSYSVSHDLRAPLRAITAFSEALLEEYGQNLDPNARSYVDRIIRASTRMDQLTQDVLKYSRVARGEVQLAPVKLEPLLQELIASYPELQEPQATINIHSPLLPVMAHEPSLVQCLANLVGNAVKFTREGVKPLVDISTVQNNSHIQLFIKDNGIGIDPQYKNRLFKMFERLNPSENVKGTGIGLAIVRKAVEKMGGRVGLESDGKTGTTFWIELAAPSKAVC